MAADPAASVLPQPAGPGLRRWLARAVLGLLGWRLDLTWPTVPRCVIIVYPHTSNWDFFLGYLAKLATGVPVQWVGRTPSSAGRWRACCVAWVASR
jgi:hypothetical protein